jgi:adenylyltransferase/sulfurtransferase
MNERQIPRPGRTSLETPEVRATPPLILQCVYLVPRNPRDEAPVWDRQSQVPGFSQETLSRLKVLLVGAGALGGEIAEGLVRKGVGTLKILDFDTVSLSNLNRQFFFPEDLYQPKAWALARNVAPHGTMGTRVVAHDLSFENAQEGGVDLDCNVVISAVDDAATRLAITRFALERNVPALFGGASVEADYASLFVQEPDRACFFCAFPEHEGMGRTPCPGSPAIKDLFKQLGGLALTAVDSLFMERPRNWNLCGLCPSDPTATRSGTVKRRPDCPVCGGAQ